jgi:hypothetical protein
MRGIALLLAALSGPLPSPAPRGDGGPGTSGTRGAGAPRRAPRAADRPCASRASLARRRSRRDCPSRCRARHVAAVPLVWLQANGRASIRRSAVRAD